ncbi:MAG: non-canonical purine NTP pyrophosphatase [Deltaproteobacteria bacterium]|nr:non-canonical purine NTP pyrophosphatase [Deltaproteobacteria bacterium]
MKSVLFGTLNLGKLREARMVCNKFGLNLVAPSEIRQDNYVDFGLDAWPGPVPEIEETCQDYLGNARLKARGFWLWSGIPSISDDSGLEVEALGGAPGILSARFAGESCDFNANIEKLLALLQGERQRRARFRCLICCVFGEEREFVCEGVLNGQIGYERRGQGGFGYDSVFLVDGYDKTLSQIKEEGLPVKTHRVLALEKLADLDLSAGL